jgi:hypothetical protein
MPAILRSSVDLAESEFNRYLGDDYVYGGTGPGGYNPGFDCSGLVDYILYLVVNGTTEGFVRNMSTESYRYKDLGGPQPVGPFSLYHVASYTDFPPSAVVLINLHHEGQGGPDSHMNCAIRNGSGLFYMESNGSVGVCTLGKSGAPQYGGAMAMSNSYWNDWYYLAGPIMDDTQSLNQIAEVVVEQFL